MFAKLLDKLLSILPFNGDKTKLGFVLTLITLGQAIAGDPDAQLFVQAVVSAVTLGTGLFHKYVKAKV